MIYRHPEEAPSFELLVRIRGAALSECGSLHHHPPIVVYDADKEVRSRGPVMDLTADAGTCGHEESRVGLPVPRIWRRRLAGGGDLLVAGGVRTQIHPGGGETVFAPRRLLTARERRVQSALDFAIEHHVALQGGCTLHACAFLIGETGVIGVGRSHAGKSSLTAAALRSGGKAVADDSIIACLGADAEPRAVPFSRDIRLREPSERLLADQYRSRLRGATFGGETRWSLTREAAPACFLPVMTPSSVWGLSIDRRLSASRVRPLSQAETLATLVVGSNALFLSPRYPHERAELMAVLTALANGCHGFRVRLGRDLLDDPERSIERLLRLTSTLGKTKNEDQMLEIFAPHRR